MKELVPRYSLRLVREHADDWTRDLQTSPQDIVRFFRDRLYDSPNEEVVMLMMATNNTIIGSALVMLCRLRRLRICQIIQINIWSIIIFRPVHTAAAIDWFATWILANKKQFQQSKQNRNQ